MFKTFSKYILSIKNQNNYCKDDRLDRNGPVVSKIPLRQRGSNLNYTGRDDRLDIKAVI